MQTITILQLVGSKEQQLEQYNDRSKNSSNNNNKINNDDKNKKNTTSKNITTTKKHNNYDNNNNYDIKQQTIDKLGCTRVNLQV